MTELTPEERESLEQARSPNVFFEQVCISPRSKKRAEPLELRGQADNEREAYDKYLCLIGRYYAVTDVEGMENDDGTWTLSIRFHELDQ